MFSKLISFILLYATFIENVSSTSITTTAKANTESTTKLSGLLLAASMTICVNQDDNVCNTFIQSTPVACVTNSYYINGYPFNVYCAKLCNYNCYVAPTTAQPVVRYRHRLAYDRY